MSIDTVLKQEVIGRVKWQNAKNGYGMITCEESNEDVFFHRSELKVEGFPYCPPGVRVKFDLVKREGNEKNNGLRAKSITVVVD